MVDNNIHTTYNGHENDNMDAHNNKQLNVLTVDMVENNIHTPYNGHEKR